MKGVLRIAIVDDDESFRRSLSNLLSSAGYGVDAFASAEGFLEAPMDVERHCLILDVRMGPMNGVELLAELARRGVQTPAIVLTAFGDARLRLRATALGARAFLTKPVQPNALLGSVAAAIRGD